MRDFIDKKEGKLTITRFIGFCMMMMGILALIACSFSLNEKVPNIIAIAFFLTMLGFSMAFPSLLEGSEGLSTMRIVVFMITNVVCMLLLKIGWSSSITSLDQIGIDQYWVGIIAFAFGAKATQSFFESKMAVPKESAPLGVAALNYNSADIARMALSQNAQFLKDKFPNILSVSDAVKDSDSSHVIAIYLRDKNIAEIPSQLEVLMPDRTKKIIDTEIIKDTGRPRIQYSQLDTQIAGDADMTYPGSLCCAVLSTDDKAFRGIVTSAHINTYGNFQSYNGVLNPDKQTPVFFNGDLGGKWIYKILNSTQDLAVISLDFTQAESPNFKKFKDKYHKIVDSDVKTLIPNIRMLSRNNKMIDGYIIDYNIGLDVEYSDGSHYKKNIILVSATRNRQQAQPISEDGDSGSSIFHIETGSMIGILLGTAKNFSLVLPIEETLRSFNLTTV
ncbi:MAG: hypothetical protein ABIP27_09365 [Flavobacterium circumlabens]|uniref:hypothetical protein n=1 Tax=Flavobacterium circumlabens TaxID=2133765 RepID=UPI003263315D